MTSDMQARYVFKTEVKPLYRYLATFFSVNRSLVYYCYNYVNYIKRKNYKHDNKFMEGVFSCKTEFMTRWETIVSSLLDVDDLFLLKIIFFHANTSVFCHFNCMPGDTRITFYRYTDMYIRSVLNGSRRWV